MSKSSWRGMLLGWLKAEANTLWQRMCECCMLLVGIAGVMWGIAMLDIVSSGALSKYGILAREVPMGFLAILWSPLLHTSLFALLCDTIPFIILGTLVLVRSEMELFIVSGAGTILGGLVVWTIAPSGIPVVGCSGLVFAYLGYLLGVGLMDKDIPSLLVSGLVFLVYGSRLTQIIPIFATSLPMWYLNMSGLAVGVSLALMQARFMLKLEGEINAKERERLLNGEEEA